MASELEKLIDFKMLENETQKACEGEKLYWIRNEAKIRAATGKPIEYDEFRHIVDAAHLKPLEKKDAIRASDMKTVWNPFCQRKESYRN
nr:coiled-coil domain-containing protein 103 [Halyomorpha halys]